MDVIDGGLSLVYFLVVVYLITRVANFMKQTRDKLDEMDRKLEEIKVVVDERTSER
ncbi:hypothetical protein [Sporosarcina trichiuri]|uniref:hypothetical protein n=1 Tax=Sporosarcina trichiuri TaxID=3056445 RepID=UPI0025B40FFF|nr:hypothetical protein [Sporosarcina sp. 0.2-SM1T-5]WJY27287.1 hypothetical protein QWT68_14795 [Sporosarcina sp. 0.2-SM1T-5]